MKLGLLGRAPAEYDDAFMTAMARAYLAQTPWTRLRLAAIRDLVEPQPGDQVLDLGSAGGAVAHFLSTYECEVVGVDSEAHAATLASALFPALRFEVADVRELPFAARSFDKAVAADLVEHLEDAPFERMLDEVRRVLRPGGTLSIYTPNAKHPIERLKARDLILASNVTHVALREQRSLVAALGDAGFRVDRDEWRPSFFPGLRLVESVGGRRIASLRYRLCVRGRLLD